MISPECRGCGNELDSFGAILLGPPMQDSPNEGRSIGCVIKSHICKECYNRITLFIEKELPYRE